MSPADFIRGSEQLVARLGGWTSFHDAEVIRLNLDRSGAYAPFATMLVHTWQMTSKVDERGYFVLEKHTLVEFAFHSLLKCELVDFNHQNVLSSLNFERKDFDNEPAVYTGLNSSYGLSGSIVSKLVEITSVGACNAQGK